MCWQLFMILSEKNNSLQSDLHQEGQFTAALILILFYLTTVGRILSHSTPWLCDDFHFLTVPYRAAVQYSTVPRPRLGFPWRHILVCFWLMTTQANATSKCHPHLCPSIHPSIHRPFSLTTSAPSCLEWTNSSEFSLFSCPLPVFHSSTHKEVTHPIPIPYPYPYPSYTHTHTHIHTDNPSTLHTLESTPHHTHLPCPTVRSPPFPWLALALPKPGFFFACAGVQWRRPGNNRVGTTTMTYYYILNPNLSSV